MPMVTKTLSLYTILGLTWARLAWQRLTRKQPPQPSRPLVFEYKGHLTTQETRVEPEPELPVRTRLERLMQGDDEL